MEEGLNVLAVIVAVLNLAALGAERHRAVIRLVAAQGLCIGIMPLLVHEHSFIRAAVLAAFTVALKGFVLPGILLRTVRDTGVRRDTDSRIGATHSLLLGAAGTALVLKFSQNLPLAPGHAGQLLVPASLATVLTAFVILTTRASAVSHVIGYLVLENGILVFGVLLLGAMPLLVEMGCLLDLFVAVFIMGLLIGRISRHPLGSAHAVAHSPTPVSDTPPAADPASLKPAS